MPVRQRISPVRSRAPSAISQATQNQAALGNRARENLYGQAKDAARDATDAAANYAKDAYENSGDTFATARRRSQNPCRTIRSARC